MTVWSELVSHSYNNFLRINLINDKMFHCDHCCLPLNILSMYLLIRHLQLKYSTEHFSPLYYLWVLPIATIVFELCWFSFSVGLQRLKILTVSVNLTCTTEWRFALVCPRDLSALASIEAVNVVLPHVVHLSPVLLSIDHITMVKRENWWLAAVQCYVSINTKFNICLVEFWH